MRRAPAIAISLWMWAFAAHAAQPKDYAFGAPIQVRGGDALYVAELPEHVYQNAVRDDLSDVTVFDAAGAELPFMLRRQPLASSNRVLVELPIFPLRSRSEEKIDSSAMRVVRDAEGRLTEINTDVAARRDAVVSAYIFDASQLSERAAALVIEWPSEGPADAIMAQVTLAASDDLKNWHDAGNGVLSRLNFGGRTLEQRRIEPEVMAKYYRLSWSNLPQPLELARVVAELAPKVVAPPLRWQKIAPTVAADAYEFDAGGPFPAERVRINFVGSSAIVTTRLYSRPSPQAAWRLRYDGPIYDLRVNGLRFNHSELDLPQGGGRYWRVESPRGSGSAPTLELGWSPHQVIFIARGQPPYQLAFGRAADPVDHPDSVRVIESLLAQKVIATPVKIGALRELGGPQRLQAEMTLPWRKWLLWLALVLGVAVLAWMATRLLRDIGAASQTDDSIKPPN